MNITLEPHDIDLICDALVILKPDNEPARQTRDFLLDALGPYTSANYRAPGDTDEDFHDAHGYDEP